MGKRLGNTVKQEYGNFIGFAITPTVLTATQNNYNPSGFAGPQFTILRLSSNASHSLTGIQNTKYNKLIILKNVGSNNIVLLDENLSSLAVNRFAIPLDFTLPPNAACLCQYDTITKRWNLVSAEGYGVGYSEIGSAIGQMLYWDGTSEYKHTEVTELFWDDVNKRLGIGESSPDVALHVKTALNSENMLFETTHAANGRIGFDLKTGFTANAGDFFRFNFRGDLKDIVQTAWDESGQVFIEMLNWNYGTGYLDFGTTKVVDLYVGDGSSNLPFDILGDANAFIRFDNDDITLGDVRVGAASDDLALWSGGSVSVTVKDDGKVGIGTTTPDDTFQVAGNAIIGDGVADTDYTLTFDGDDNDGVLTWKEAEDYFQFSDDILLANGEKLYLRDTAIGIYSQADTFLDLFADGGVRIGDSSAGAPTNYMNVAPDGEVTLLGTARTTECMWLPAGGIRAPGAKPATFVECGLIGAWRFADAIEANQESVSGALKIPCNMDRSVVPLFHCGWSANGVSPGNCEWQLEYLWMDVNEDTCGAAQETLTSTATASATSDGFVFTTFTGIDLPSATDKAMFYKITRLSADGNDTIADTVELRGLAFTRTVNKLGVAT